MPSLYKKIAEKAVNFWLPKMSAMSTEESFQVRTIVQLSLVFGILVLCAAILMLVLPLKPIGQTVGLFFAFLILLGVSVSLVTLRAGVSAKLSANILLFSIWGAMFSSYFFLGGLSSPNAPLLILVPAIAGTMGMKKAVVAWTVMIVLSWLVLLLLSNSGHQFTQFTAPDRYLFSVFICLVIASVVVTAVVFVFANINRTLRIALDNSNQTLQYQAGHDPLTHLANRRSYFEQLKLTIQRAQHQHMRFALLMVDLDGFKAINDTYGHQAGDRALQAIAERLQHSIRHSDFIARLGGDEFVVLMEDVLSREDVAELADKLRRSITIPVALETGDVQLGASIGVAMYPDHGQDSESLQESADRAMYSAKAQGIDCVYAD